MNILAQKIRIGSEGTGISISGPLKLPGISGTPKLADIIGVVITYLFPIAGVILFFIIIWGGYDLLMSEGEAEKLEAGRSKITSGIIGMVLLVLSYFFARLVGYIFGIGGGLF